MVLRPEPVSCACGPGRESGPQLFCARRDSRRVSLVLVERTDAVLRITLNRPDQRNALNPDIVRALHDAFTKAASDPGVRAIVLAAEGPVFCAGGDFRDMAARKGRPDLTHARQSEGFAPLARAILGCAKPVIARVQGDAHGAGLMLALLADFAVVADHARLGVTFARAGLVPDSGASWLLPQLVGLRAARELYLRSGIIDASRAVVLGMVSEAVAADALDSRVAALAAELAEGPTVTFGLGKAALVAGATSTFDEALAREAALQGLAFATADQQAAVDAFLGKQKPVFSGR